AYSGTSPQRPLAVVKALYASHGLPIYYKGVSAAVARAFPANGVLFASYEFVSAALIQYT
ncbi:MAG: MC/SLC25 family protein, partial [Terracidiphilus sp.]|nr:MC/SLC25 family protein [Terracidiphilus sp.]